MGVTWLRRRLLGPRRCAARQCPHPRVRGLSRWCRDHTDAILVGATLPTDVARKSDDWDRDLAAAAHRLGARRWLLLAEVALEREALHVDVLEGIVAQTPRQRDFNRPCWTLPHLEPNLSTPLDDRANELLSLEPCPPAGESPFPEPPMECVDAGVDWLGRVQKP